MIGLIPYPALSPLEIVDPAQSNQRQVAGLSTRAIHHRENFAAETGAPLTFHPVLRAADASIDLSMVTTIKRGIV